MPHFVFVNDSLVPADEASLLIGDLAIQRGYGIFDFFKTMDGEPVYLDEHLDRFFHSAAAMRLDAGVNRVELKQRIGALLERNGIANSGVRLTLTGGYSPDGYSLAQPNLVIHQSLLAVPVSAEPTHSIRLMTYPHLRQLPEVKTIDYLVAIWLQPLLREKGADDVLYHRDGVIAECPRSNFFLLTDRDVLVTPGTNILKGITRMKVLEAVNGRLATEEREVLLAELTSANEVFITSTTKHVVPVTEVDGVRIGDGRIGPVAKWVSAELYKRAAPYGRR
ncbi:MAG TPA: aminotransferase class IV [Puia sp.]|uniref:aminotransferase class IV n=1 Tax=Puia sp. TaxID=2045100 RepID=UPI002BDF1FBE|nr:aminotransferase class IV [Puia sp.]HVU99540.1 aminotransferase class IV [Puia sp.]